MPNIWFIVCWRALIWVHFFQMENVYKFNFDVNTIVKNAFINQQYWNFLSNAHSGF